MAYRKPAGRKVKVSEVLPIWGVSQTNTVNMAFEALMRKLGIGTMRDYFRKLRVLIAISVLVCALTGASGYGLKGFVFGGLLGLAAPAAILFFGVLLVGILIYMAIYVAAWALVICFLWWFLSAMFGG